MKAKTSKKKSRKKRKRKKKNGSRKKSRGTDKESSCLRLLEPSLKKSYSILYPVSQNKYIPNWKMRNNRRRKTKKTHLWFMIISSAMAVQSNPYRGWDINVWIVWISISVKTVRKISIIHIIYWKWRKFKISKKLSNLINQVMTTSSHF